MRLEDIKKEYPLDIAEREIKLLAQLVTFRRDNHISQKELAEKIGMTQSQLSKIEIGDTIPKLDTLLRIAEGLELELTFISKKEHKEIAPLL